MQEQTIQKFRDMAKTYYIAICCAGTQTFTEGVSPSTLPYGGFRWVDETPFNEHNIIQSLAIENLRKRRNIELRNKEQKRKKLINSPNFHTFKEFDNEFVAVEHTKTFILMKQRRVLYPRTLETAHKFPL